MIRLATADDADAVAAIYAPFIESTVITFEVTPLTGDEMRTRMLRTLDRCPWLVAEVDGRVVGYAYAGPHRERAAYQWAADVAIYLDAQVHRRGIGRALYSALFPMLVRQGYVTAYAGITLPNEKSVGLHEALGFTPVGVYRNVGFKMERWLDVGWWQLQLQALPQQPRPVIAWKDIEV